MPVTIRTYTATIDTNNVITVSGVDMSGATAIACVVAMGRGATVVSTNLCKINPLAENEDIPEIAKPQVGGGQKTVAFFKLNPTTAGVAVDVRFDMSPEFGNPGGMAACVIVFLASNDKRTTYQATASPPSVTVVDSQLDDLVIDFLGIFSGFGAPSDPAAGAGQSEVVNITATGGSYNCRLKASTETAVGANTVMSWAAAGMDSAQVAYAVIPRLGGLILIFEDDF